MNELHGNYRVLHSRTKGVPTSTTIHSHLNIKRGCYTTNAGIGTFGALTGINADMGFLSYRLV